jgi:hypothetical protein
MALLQLMSEEPIHEEHLTQYFEDFYRVVCVSERVPEGSDPGTVVRTTYLVDWEQLVHLLEDYGRFAEDIVEVAPVRGDEARLLHLNGGRLGPPARA